MDIDIIKVSDIIPYKKNAKKHPDSQVEHIANSIKEFGFRQPLVIDKNNVLVIGHGRLLAAKKLGLEYVPVARADDLTDEQIKALRLVDNKTNESDWDFDFLDDEINDIFDIDMSDFGFDILDAELEHEKQAELTQDRVEDILNLNKGSFEGTGKLCDRIQSHEREDEWCKDKAWYIEYFECDNQSEVEAFEAHLIALYGTNKYYNFQKGGWGLNKYLPDVEKWWKPATIPLCEDFETLKAVFAFKRALKNRCYKEAHAIYNLMSCEVI